MQSKDWLEIKEVFAKTIELPEPERFPFLAAFDYSVQIEVKKLLKSYEKLDNFIEKPAIEDVGLADGLLTDKIIDDYKIVEIIGEGGMGLVCLAERQGFEQKVALKLIKRGMDSRAILGRFYLERQILSRLNHPNIAKLLDGGTTEDGLPYFVMEYVEGKSLLKFCDERGFDITERLELFQKVCDAVNYAHQNLVVHRDLKPSNILVTDDGTPKLLDFGIAKLLDEDSETTATQARIFTPEYASPEQLSGLPITTSTDIYSLGAVLYELLSGVRPFNFKSKNYAEIARLILTYEPVRPSYAWREADVKRRGDTEKNTDVTGRPHKSIAASQLKGDLDNIILMSIRKEPQERYASVHEFSEDIRRHLAGLPVMATTDSPAYRFRKFVVRHKIGTALATIILMLSGVSVWQAFVANSERAKSERRLIETRKIANSLMFEIHDSLKDLPGATKSRELLVKRALEYLDALYQESTNDPELLKELSVAYRKVADIQGEPNRPNLVQSAEALKNYLRAFEIQENLVNLDPNDLNLQNELSKTAYNLGFLHQIDFVDYYKAIYYLRVSQKHMENICLKNPDDANSKSRLALIYNIIGGLSYELKDTEGAVKNRELALKLIEEALQIEPDNLDILKNGASLFSLIGNGLGNPDYNDEGEPEKALPLLQRALLLREKQYKLDPTSIITYTNVGVSTRDLGDFYMGQNDLVKAIEYFQKALKIHEELAEKDSNGNLSQASVALSRLKLATALTRVGRLEESLKLNKLVLSYYEKRHKQDENSDSVAYSYGLGFEGIANTYFAQSNFDAALEKYERSVALINKVEQRASSTNTEFQLAKARFLLKLGKTRQKLNRECKLYLSDFQLSSQIYELVKNNDHLSPANTEFLMEAKKLADAADCK